MTPNRTSPPKHKICRERHTLIALIIITLFIITFQPSAIPVRGDFYGPNHDSERFGGSWTGRSVCSICHGGLTYDAEGGGIAPVEASDIFENYRCAACHMTVTRTLVENTLDSAHNVVSCTYCHDSHHEGHRSYSTSYRGLYGCYGSNCHNIVTQDYYPPSRSSKYFTVTHPGTDTAYISFSSKKVIFNPTGYSAARGIYPATFIDPATGSFADIPKTNRYWMCLKCHFVQKGSLLTTTSQATNIHPDLCYYCHSLSLGDPHDITKDNDLFITMACTNCHNSVGQSVASSIHSSIGCRCHSVEHISRYNGSAAWVFLFSPPQGDYITPTIPSDFLTWLNPLYYYGGTNASSLGVNVLPIADPSTGTPHYLNMTYVTRSGDASIINTKIDRLITCFNCHFVPMDSLQASIRSLFPGTIGAPSLDPHSIKPLTEQPVISTHNPGNEYGRNITLVAAFIGAALTGLVIILILSSREVSSKR